MAATRPLFESDAIILKDALLKYVCYCVTVMSTDAVSLRTELIQFKDLGTDPFTIHYHYIPTSRGGPR